jgi:hypothetical protein
MLKNKPLYFPNFLDGNVKIIRNDQERMESLNKLLANDKIGFIKPLENFNSLLQKGYFSNLYTKEREIESRLSRYNYEKAIIDSFEPVEARKPPVKKPQENGFMFTISSSRSSLNQTPWKQQR